MQNNSNLMKSTSFIQESNTISLLMERKRSVGIATRERETGTDVTLFSAHLLHLYTHPLHKSDCD